ncbi:RNA polymerase sigma factor [Methylobacterium ajmalii]|uniref:RNA polymerase sigma factor n=1 Tax=Methylobacterium ajmalii TaxID=2738439 RepID=A0ABU9ZZC8_9HYPH
MNVQDGVSLEHLREFWQEATNGGSLDKHDPRTIVAACRRLDPAADRRLREQLLNHLCATAQRILRPQVSARHENRGEDAVLEVVGAMVVSILDPDSADGIGFETSFRGRLKTRLIDRVRKEEARRKVIRHFDTDPDDGTILEPRDWQSFSQEDMAVISSALDSLPPNQRRALLLRRSGFGYTGPDGESISSMLGVTPKTAKDWVERAEKHLLAELGREI